MDWLDKIVTPRVGVVAIVESWDDEILLIRRKFPPLGLAFPGGFMEMGETIAQTAAREVLEETGIVAEEVGLLDVTSGVGLDPRAQFVVVTTVFRTRQLLAEPVADDDALEAFWVPWRTLKASIEWGQLTERTKLEFGEYCRWQLHNEDWDHWDLPKLK